MGLDNTDFQNLRLTYVPTAVVPEPSQFLLLGVIAAGAGFYGWRRRRKCGPSAFCCTNNE